MDRVLEGKSVYLERDGIRLHAIDYGEAGKPILLLLHGAAAHAHWWDKMAPAFGDLFRPVGVDMRGHGDSDWASDYSHAAMTDDLAAWIAWAQREGGTPPAIIAHSLGGAITLMLCERRPLEVLALVLVDVPLRIGERILRQVGRFGKKPSRPWDSARLFVEKFRLVPSSGRADPEEVANIAGHSIRPLEDGTWLLKTDRAFHRSRVAADMRPGWRAVTVPTLLIVGAESDRLSRKEMDWIRENAPQARIEVLPEAHHHVQLDQRESFLRVARDFLLQGDSLR